MGPRGIEVHVNRKRTSEPDGKGREEGPFFDNVFPGEGKGQQEPKKSVKCRTKRHGQDVGHGESVRLDMPTEKVAGENEKVRQEEKWRPKNCWTHGEEIAYIASLGIFLRQKLTIGMSSGLSKVQIAVPPIFFEVKIMLDERGANIGVVANTISMDDGID
jgi:hypothetical protein